MSRSWRAFALILFASAVFSASLRAAGPQANARENVLLLRNGRVLRGHITPLGDVFIVAFDERNEIRVPADQVEMHCESIVDAYLQRRNALTLGNATAHLDLADWCLRENLLDQALEQLTAAARFDPQNPRVQHMTLRLQVARQPRSEPDITPRGNVVPSEEVADEVQSLPAHAIAQFATSIQPILLNRCGTAACHGPTTTTSFRLLRPAWAKSLPQRLTHRNLHSTLQLVDRNQLDASPLLRISREPHGGAETPIFEDPEHYQWRQLQAWVRQLGPTAAATTPVAFAPPNTILSRPATHVAARLPDPSADRVQPPPLDSHSAPAAPNGNSNVGYQPRDPFDPEIFNRRFFPDASSQPRN